MACEHKTKFFTFKKLNSNIVLLYKESHEVTKSHLAAHNQYHCQHCRTFINLAVTRSHIQSNENENIKDSGTMKFVKRL